MSKEKILQVRIGTELEKKIKKEAKRTHSGQISAFVRDALHDKADNIEVSSGYIRLPFSMLSVVEERARKAGLPVEEFVRYILAKGLVDEGE